MYIDSPLPPRPPPFLRSAPWSPFEYKSDTSPTHPLAPRPQLLSHLKLAFKRYCNHQYCMVFGIHRRSRWGGVYCAMVMQ